MNKRAIIYLRVSSTEQSVDNQKPELERVCEEKDWEIVETLTEEASAWQCERETFQKLFDMAHQQKYDVLVVWSLDRLDRRGIQETFQFLQRLDEHGVQFYSYKEPYLSTLNSHTRGLIISVLSWVAEMESERRSERVKAGMQRARTEGKQIGRPSKINKEKRKKITNLRDQGMSYRAIADEMNLGKTTVYEVLN